jgi:hypothetical protein
MQEDKATVDVKLFHNGMLHGFINNGGTLKLNNRFGIELKYNDKNPTSPMVELSVFVVPIGSQFTGKVNPSLARAQATKQKQEKAQQEQEELFKIEEGDVIEG